MRTATLLHATLSLLLAAACSAKPAERVNEDLTFTEVPCLLAAGERESTAVDAARAKQDVSGPAWCQRALELFLERHPDQRIAAVVPIQHTVPPPPGVLPGPGEGTQRLMVVHTASGTKWPRAGDLAIYPVECTSNQPVAGQPELAPTSGRRCVHAVRDFIANGLPNSLWVPIVDLGPAQQVEIGTRRVLVLHPGAR